MIEEMRDYILIAAISVFLVALGIWGIARKGGDFKMQEHRQAGVMLALGELGSGIIGLGYLVYVFWIK